MKSSFLSNNLRFHHISNKPVVSYFIDLLRYGLAVVLLIAGVAKLANASALLQTLHQVSFLIDSMIIWIATLLPVLELGLTIALLLHWMPLLTTTATAALFAGFLGFTIYGMVLHLTGGCGCFGNLPGTGIGWGMVIQDFVLFLAASLLCAHVWRP